MDVNNKKKKIIIISSIVISCIIILCITLYILMQSIYNVLNIETFYNGIYIENIDFSSLDKNQATDKINELQQQSTKDIKLSLKYGDKIFYLSSENLKFNYDTNDIVEQAYNYGRKGNIFKRYETVQELKKEPKKFFITAKVDEDSVKEQIKNIAQQINKQAVDSGIKFTYNEPEMFKYINGHDGIQVNEEELFNTIKHELSTNKFDSEVEIQIPTTTIPHKSKSMEEFKEETQLIAKFTTVSTNNANGNSNMRLALSKINGTVLQPNETFSYNDTLGNSTTPAGGWLPAGAIQDGALVQEYGGGICQVSTTLYGAVLRSGLKVTQRRNHSFPIGYVDIGQDAAVSYGSLDFKFTNNYDTPIYVKSYMSGVTLVIEIYGKKSKEWDNISVSSKTTQVMNPPSHQIIQDNTILEGKQVLEKQARTGYKAQAWRTYYKNGQVVKTENLSSSNYAPVQGVIRVGTKKPEQPTPAEPVLTEDNKAPSENTNTPPQNNNEEVSPNDTQPQP